MAIDVFFTGLMLLCFDGQAICRMGGYESTAWIVKADGKSKPCGRDSPVKTRLELRFLSSQFGYSSIDPEWVDCDDSDSEKTCVIKDDCAVGRCRLRSICINVDEEPRRRLDASLRWLSVLDDVDRRLKEVSLARLQDPLYVPIRLHFKAGLLGAGEKWPPQETPRRWFRSNGEAGGGFPSELSDRLKVTYEGARVLTLTNCAGRGLIKLTLNQTESIGKVTLINSAFDGLTAEGSEGYDDLFYLSWYYRLGIWDTKRPCPNFTTAEKPLVLRCAQEQEGRHCSCYGNCDGSTIFWQGVRLPVW